MDLFKQGIKCHGELQALRNTVWPLITAVKNFFCQELFLNEIEFEIS